MQCYKITPEMKSKYIVAASLLSVLICFELYSQTKGKDILKQIGENGNYAPMIPFQPTHNAPDNITNVQTWSDTHTGPAGADGFISVRNGCFIDGSGRQKRFLGTQCGMTGCFPTHKAAENLAKEFSRYGVNIIRMHYVSHRTPKGGYPVQNSFIEPVQLERFDYFISKLKENGIYVYFQLNIARKIGRMNGFENAHLLPKYNNGVDNADARMIALQKRFHKEILEHVNPYTGIAYKDEPCLAMLELANENSIIYSWFSEKHNFPNLVEPYRGMIVEKWNKWLLGKYGNTESLKSEWLKGTEGDGAYILSDRGDGVEKWVYDQKKIKAFPRKKAKRDAVNNLQYLRFIISSEEGKPGGDLRHKSIYLKEGHPYCLKFKIRSDSPMDIRVRLLNPAGNRPEINMVARTGLEWKEYAVNFTSQSYNTDEVLVFSNLKSGTVDIADLSIQNGLDFAWPESESLERGTVSWPDLSQWSAIHRKSSDFLEFLASVEDEYFSTLKDYIKDTIGARQPVTGTQLGYGMNLAQSGMDYCDKHCYWCHPAFPGGKWDNSHFNVRNDAIINSSGNPASVFTETARSRIYGKPFTVSEFDIPNLNFYCSEANLMMAAIGALQGWSALIQFAWILDTDYNRNFVWPQFDMCSSPQKLVHFPACYAMFVRGDVTEADEKDIHIFQSSKDSDIQAMTLCKSADITKDTGSPLLNCLPLAIKSGTYLKDVPTLVDIEGKNLIINEADVPSRIKSGFGNKELRSCTDEIVWNWQEKGKGFFVVDTKRTKVFSGFVGGRSFSFKGMKLTPGRTRLDWLTLSLTLANPDDRVDRDSSRLQPGSYLLAVTGLVQNTDMKIVQVSKNPQKLSVSEPDGGKLGTGPILCEGIEATLEFEGLGGRLQCYSLDPDGNRMEEVKAESLPDGKAVIKIGPDYRTIWYELIVK